MLPATDLTSEESRALEDSDVLGRCRERHLEWSRELTDRHRPLGESGDHRTPSRVSQCSKQDVQSVGSIVNHLVQRSRPEPRIQARSLRSRRSLRSPYRRSDRRAGTCLVPSRDERRAGLRDEQQLSPARCIPRDGRSRREPQHGRDFEPQAVAASDVECGPDAAHRAVAAADDRAVRDRDEAAREPGVDICSRATNERGLLEAIGDGGHRPRRDARHRLRRPRRLAVRTGRGRRRTASHVRRVLRRAPTRREPDDDEQRDRHDERREREGADQRPITSGRASPARDRSSRRPSRSRSRRSDPARPARCRCPSGRPRSQPCRCTRRASRAR